MIIEIDHNAGFCFGVVNAIGTAERELQEGAPLYCLGDIVHNNAEVSRLRSQGLEVVEQSQLPHLAGKRVLIRAHGEPPATYRKAEQLGIKLIDATCPIVLALQQRIRKGYGEMKEHNPEGQVVIYGKPGHAEVIGLCGQTDDTAIVVSRPDELDAIDFHRPIRLYAQTTQSREEYATLINNIKDRIEQAQNDGLKTAERGQEVEDEQFVAYNTLCSRVANRAKELEAFARRMDVVLFVSGKGSSNGHYLYEYCKRVQPCTYLVSDSGELHAEWFARVEKVGITGATSTPRWLMEEVAKSIETIKREEGAQ